MNDLELTNELTGLSESKAQQVKAIFHPMVKMLEGFEDDYSSVMLEEQTPDKCKNAKALRLEIARVRISADKARKSQKEEYLRAGQAIQSVFNVLKFAIADKEESLKEVEDYYERQEEARISRVQSEREAELIKYQVTIQTPEILGNMSDDVWVNYLNGVRQNWEDLKEAERQEEEARKESARRESEERERARQENEALKTERRKQYFLLQEQKQKLLEEQKERKRLQQEILEREQEEKKRIEHAECAPDKEKLLNFANSLSAGKADVSSHAAKVALSGAAVLLRSAANNAP